MEIKKKKKRLPWWAIILIVLFSLIIVFSAVSIIAIRAFVGDSLSWNGTLAHHGIIKNIDTEIILDKRHWNPTFHKHKYMSV